MNDNIKIVEEQITVDCPTCEAKVNAEVVACQYVSDYYDEPIPDWRISFAKCPKCESLLLARQKQTDIHVFMGKVDIQWGPAVRLWPDPVQDPNAAIPGIVRMSLEEAYQCHRAGAHTASAVMCGRALEGICAHFGMKTRLGEALRELQERRIIDERLFQWGDELRKHRNLAAHASDREISKEDSTDLLEFLSAICNYIFVLSARFDDFMKRQGLEFEINSDIGEKLRRNHKTMNNKDLKLPILRWRDPYMFKSCANPAHIRLCRQKGEDNAADIFD